MEKLRGHVHIYLATNIRRRIDVISSPTHPLQTMSINIQSYFDFHIYDTKLVTLGINHRY